MLTRFDHAHKEPVKDARMFGNGFIESFAALHVRSHIADDVPKVALAFRIALLVKSGQSFHECDAGLDHRRKLAREQNQVGLLN